MFLRDEILIAIFAMSGISLKLADFYGEKEGNIVSYIFSTITALGFGLVISHSPISSSLILGITVGVIMSKKVNRPNLVFGIVLTLSTALILGLKLPVPWLLLTVAVFSFIDEIIHDFLSSKSFSNHVLSVRPFLKLAIFSITALSLIDVVYAAGFFCFDLSYDATNLILNRNKI